MTLDGSQRPPLDPEDVALFARAGAAEFSPPPTPPGGRAEPAIVLTQQRLDFATAALYQQLLRRPANREFMDAVLSGRTIPPPEPPLVGIVPGAFYRQHRNTGADGARVLNIVRQIGFRAELIPVRSFGRLTENAALIRAWVRRQGNRPLALIALSKGAADCQIALAGPGLEGDPVRAWINLSGLVDGTPLIAWLRRQPLRMLGVRLLLGLRGQSFAAADDLRHGAAAPLSFWPPLPTALKLVHVLAFPLRRHLRHPWAGRAYERLAPLGPNDGGGILLEDSLGWPGIACPVWGADHYLEPAWDATPFLRNVLLAALAPTAGPPQASASAAAPSIAPATRSTK